MSYLSDLLGVEQMNLELRGSNKEEVLRELCSVMAPIRGEDAQQKIFLKALLERELLHTTAIGDGIALPHTRNPLGDILKMPVVVFGRHKEGVGFGALDEKPVQLFFLLAAPNLTEHLSMLARISRVLRDPPLRNGLLSATSPAEVLKLIDETERRVIK